VASRTLSELECGAAAPLSSQRARAPARARNRVVAARIFISEFLIYAIRVIRSSFLRVYLCPFVVKDSHGAAKPISIGASDLFVFTITALSGCTSTSLYLISSFGFRENSWSFLTSNSRRPPQV